jgi:4-hydroxybenzoate polyprenyltransferase
MAISFQLSKSGFEPIAAAISLVLGIYLLLIPAIRLYQSKSRSDAMALFNKSSYYPVALLATVLISFII